MVSMKKPEISFETQILMYGIKFKKKKDFALQYESTPENNVENLV